MTPTRVGIDIVPLRRAEELIAGPDEILRRHLTPDEIEDSHRGGRLDGSCVAGRLAGKEATFKLLHSPGAVLPWLSIVIVNDVGGWPLVRLHGRAAALAAEAGLEHVDMSIAHDGGFAVAAAVAAVDPRVPTDADRSGHSAPDLVHHHNPGGTA